MGMADYAGEPIRIATHNALNFDGTRIVPADVYDVTVEVFNSDLTQTVLPVTVMTFIDDPDDDADGEFAYIWDTSGLEAGTYKAKVVINTIDNFSSWEYHRIRLKIDPHPGP